VAEPTHPAPTSQPSPVHSNRTSSPDNQDSASIIRAMIEHENEQQNNRLTWLLTVQGLLFAGLSFAWDKTDARQLVQVLCLMGALVALSSWAALRVSKQAMASMRDWWDRNKPEGYAGPDVVGYRSQGGFLLWLIRPWRFLPWVFFVGWILVFVLNSART